MDSLTFSNPRLVAEFDDWPSGRHKVKCKFDFESHPKRGMRIRRTTTHPNGTWNNPKLDTFGGPGAIVDGSDGKTYVLQFASLRDFIYIKRSDFMQEAAVFPRDHQFEELKTLIEQAQG